jgi:hypothetical protein
MNGHRRVLYAGPSLAGVSTSLRYVAHAQGIEIEQFTSRPGLETTTRDGTRLSAYTDVRYSYFFESSIEGIAKSERPDADAHVRSLKPLFEAHIEYLRNIDGVVFVVDSQQSHQNHAGGKSVEQLPIYQRSCEAMVCRWSAKEHQAGNGAEEGCGIDQFLNVMNFVEALVEGQHNQKSSKYLGALQQNSQLLQHVVQASTFRCFAITRLGLGIYVFHFNRLLEFGESTVTFAWKDRRRESRSRTARPGCQRFIRCLLLQVLRRGFSVFTIMEFSEIGIAR